MCMYATVLNFECCLRKFECTQTLDRTKWTVTTLISRVVIFEMAAMPLPCNGILLIQGNLPTVFPVLT